MPSSSKLLIGRYQRHARTLAIAESVAVKGTLVFAGYPFVALYYLDERDTCCLNLPVGLAAIPSFEIGKQFTSNHLIARPFKLNAFFTGMTHLNSADEMIHQFVWLVE
jgi:hypothetical protein